VFGELFAFLNYFDGGIFLCLSDKNKTPKCR